MIHKLNILFFLIFIVLLSSCKEEKGTTIEGIISNGSNLTVFLDKLELEAREVIDKAEASGNGQFSINFPEGLPTGLYRVRAGAKSASIIVEGGEKNIKIQGSLDDFQSDTYTITGSPLTEKFLNKMNGFRNNAISSEEATEQILDSEPLVALLLGLKSMPLRPEYAQQHAQIANYAYNELSSLPIADQYKKYSDNLVNQYNRMMASQKVKVGEPAPDIALEDPDGNIRKLSELRGKVVLLDFWASWCGPCRRENPKVVKTYQKYKDQGFTVYSVSLDGIDERTSQRLGDSERVQQYLDSSKKRWLDAIKKDNLMWDYHVSDLKKWDSAAASQYGVRSIPKTFLIDRDGTIAALNPRRNLEEELLKVL